MNKEAAMKENNNAYSYGLHEWKAMYTVNVFIQYGQIIEGCFSLINLSRKRQG
jgi:hypothetical protein